MFSSQAKPLKVIRIVPYDSLIPTLFKGIDAYRLRFPFKTMSELDQLKLRYLVVPDQKVGVLFIGSSWVGLKANRDYFTINNNLYERINHRDIGNKLATGLKVYENNCLVWLMRDLGALSGDSGQAIVDAISKALKP